MQNVTVSEPIMFSYCTVGPYFFILYMIFHLHSLLMTNWASYDMHAFLHTPRRPWCTPWVFFSHDSENHTRGKRFETRDSCPFATGLTTTLIERASSRHAYGPKEDILSSDNMLIEWAIIETVKHTYRMRFSNWLTIHKVRVRHSFVIKNW